MWIQTYKGHHVCPMKLKPCDIDIIDIAHALSNQCRFSGHSLYFYSVAEHSCFVAAIIKAMIDAGEKLPVLNKSVEELMLKGLLHDASEAYLVDIPRPIKPYLENYVQAEKEATESIYQTFGLVETISDHEIIKEADNRALTIEAEILMGAPTDWDLPTYARKIKIPPPLFMMPQQAEKIFYQTFISLKDRI